MPGCKGIRKFSTPWPFSAPWPRERGSRNSAKSATEDWLCTSCRCKTHQQSTINLIMSDTYVPLISSGVAGPLGVLHLPRMWQKVSLEATGKLASGYPGIGRGLDAMTCADLGLEEQAVKDYIQKNKPTYPRVEAQVK